MIFGSFHDPAVAAGLLPGDVILGYNGKDVPTSSALPPLVGATPVGEAVTVEPDPQDRPFVLFSSAPIVLQLYRLPPGLSRPGRPAILPP